MTHTIKRLLKLLKRPIPIANKQINCPNTNQNGVSSQFIVRPTALEKFISAYGCDADSNQIFLYVQRICLFGINKFANSLCFTCPHTK